MFIPVVLIARFGVREFNLPFAGMTGAGRRDAAEGGFDHWVHTLETSWPEPDEDDDEMPEARIVIANTLDEVKEHADDEWSCLHGIVFLTVGALNQANFLAEQYTWLNIAILTGATDVSNAHERIHIHPKDRFDSSPRGRCWTSCSALPLARRRLPRSTAASSRLRRSRNPGHRAHHEEVGLDNTFIIDAQFAQQGFTPQFMRWELFGPFPAARTSEIREELLLERWSHQSGPAGIFVHPNLDRMVIIIPQGAQDPDGFSVL